MGRSFGSMRAFTVGGAIAIAGMLSVATLAGAQDAVKANPQSTVGDITQPVEAKSYFEKSATVWVRSTSKQK